MIGVAQERANVFRAPAKSQRQPGTYAATRGSGFVKYVYFYIWDNDWGGSFIKVCTYARWSIRVWLNGHEWLKRQLSRQQFAFEPLDNGIAAVNDPAALRRTAARLSAAHMQRYFDRWMYRLPNPLQRPRPSRRLRAPALHPAARGELHRGLRPSPAWPAVLRGGDPR